MFVDQFKKSKVLEHDFQYWRRFTNDDPNKTYHWLRGRIEIHLDEELSERNKKAQLKAHEAKAKGHDPIFGGFSGKGKKTAMPAVDGGGRGGKGGGKNKGKLDELPRSHPPPSGGGKAGYTRGVFAGGMTEADVRKLDCYFFHVKGMCKFGDQCFMKHTPISAAQNAKLQPPRRKPDDGRPKGPASKAVPAKAKAPASHRADARVGERNLVRMGAREGGKREGEE